MSGGDRLAVYLFSAEKVTFYFSWLKRLSHVHRTELRSKRAMKRTIVKDFLASTESSIS